MKTKLAVVFAVLAIGVVLLRAELARAMVATIGNVLVLSKYNTLASGLQPILPTCSADVGTQMTEGGIVRMLGGANETDTKLCICKSDGAASPAYQWCSITITGASTVVCAGGSATVCP